MIGSFTMGGVLLRSMNRLSPAYDYTYLITVLTFDFLLLDSFADANQYRDGVYSILMVLLGGLFTCVVGVFLFPQFSGNPLQLLYFPAAGLKC